jgi:poly(3-hydroxybutyrate) depolymerase
MALQMEVAFSSFFSGAAIIAGIPYYCAQNGMLTIPDCTLYPTLIPVATLEQDMTKFASNGQIDSLNNLRSHSLYLFSGLLDTVVTSGVVKTIEKIASDLGVTKILSVYSIAAEHSMPTNDWGSLCPVLSVPFINNCNYDGAGKALAHLYGNLKSPVTPIGELIKLDQSKYTPNNVNPASISMATYAYVYLPTQCHTKSNITCKLHISFHGCIQGSDIVSTTYVNHAGWNKWAESNNIIVLYPQTIVSLVNPINPQGCWDWWGYTSGNYAFKNSPQMVTVRNMINYIIQTY